MEKLQIWGKDIPGNSPRSKLEDMEIDRNTDPMTATIRFIQAIIKDSFSDEKKAIDTFTWLNEIKDGHARETYEDTPYLTPFLVEGSKKAVLVVPGGGFSYLSMDADPVGMQGEGDLVAKALNARGISAFVLWYRTNPYHQPIPFMDMQRAVRYIRYHAVEFGIDANKIGAIGFSAGGCMVAGLLSLMAGKDAFPEGYVPDAVDQASDALDFAAMVYPALRYEHNYPMLFASFPADQVRDAVCRETLMEEYNCLNHISTAQIPYFISYGTDDHMISVEDIITYIGLLKEGGKDVTVIPVEGADHGFGVNPEAMKSYGYCLEGFLDWCQSL